MKGTDSKLRLLALDGGGSKGFFSVDILKKIKSNLLPGIPLWSAFDLACGSSVGAMIVAFITFGFFDDEIKQQQILEDGMQVFGDRNDSQLLAPLYTGNAKQFILKKHFQKLKMGQSLIPLAIVTTNVNGHQYVFRSWVDTDIYVWQALDASSAAPTFFPPVQIHQEWYYDGGILSNVPIDVALNCMYELWDPYTQPSAYFPHPAPFAIQHFDSATMHPAILGSFSRQRPLLHFALLSLGNKKFHPQEIKIENPQKMGYLACIQLGILEMILGINNTNTAEWMKGTYGEDVIVRITGDMDPSFDNVTPEFRQRLEQEADRVWQAECAKLHRFFFAP